MSSINPNRYPVDYTGTASTNAVAGEVVSLPSKRVRVFAPQNAPFFSKSVKIVDLSTGQQLSTSQWKPFALVGAVTQKTDMSNPVYALIAITDQSVGSNISVSYQTVGSDFVTGYENLKALIDSMLADDRPAQWGDVLGKEPGFNPNQHMQSITDTLNWEYVITFLDQLKLAIVLGDQLKKDTVLSYIDQALARSNALITSSVSPTSVFGQHVNTPNAHGVTATTIGLNLVQNYRVATLAEAYAGTATNLYMTTDLVRAVVQNQINNGMDAHILGKNNDHQVTKGQVGLALLENYAPAVLADLNNPSSAQPKYVTNVVLAAWLSAYFQTQRTSIDNTLQGINTAIAEVSQLAQQASQLANQASTAAAEAVTQNEQAEQLAASALLQAQENEAGVAGSVSSVNTLFSTYVAAAVAAAKAEGYDQGYAAGLAAR